MPDSVLEVLTKQLLNAQAKKDKANAEVKKASKEIIDVHNRLEIEMIAQGIVKFTTPLATITMSSNSVPHVKDWDRFHEFIKNNDALHLLQKRAMTTACRELFEKGEDIPGVEEFELTTFGVTKIT